MSNVRAEILKVDYPLTAAARISIDAPAAKIFDYLDADSTLELEPLKALVADKQLSAYRHQGFWQPMDTYRETLELNKMWEENEAPWKNW